MRGRRRRRLGSRDSMTSALGGGRRIERRLPRRRRRIQSGSAASAGRLSRRRSGPLSALPSIASAAASAASAASSSSSTTGPFPPLVFFFGSFRRHRRRPLSVSPSPISLCGIKKRGLLIGCRVWLCCSIRCRWFFSISFFKFFFAFVSAARIGSPCSIRNVAGRSFLFDFSGVVVVNYLCFFLFFINLVWGLRLRPENEIQRKKDVVNGFDWRSRRLPLPPIGRSGSYLASVAFFVWFTFFLVCVCVCVCVCVRLQLDSFFFFCCNFIVAIYFRPLSTRKDPLGTTKRVRRPMP